MVKAGATADIREHPRVRGEDSVAVAFHDDITGTPPRARGRPDTIAGEHTFKGNTPACAAEFVKSSETAAS